MGFLTDLTNDLRKRLDANPLDDSALMARALAMPPPRDFEDALPRGEVAVIAEIKRASPSAGVIDRDTDPIPIARSYAEGGAAVISVLTEPIHFHGSLLDLQAIKACVTVPVLRKDFLVHPAQVIEARANGADAVLLITACLSDAELQAMLAAVSDLGMGALVETHSTEDLDRAIEAGATVIGVNARDLETLEVRPARALELVSKIPKNRVGVVESGVSTRADVVAALAAGASGILVGEALMRAADPARKLRELRGEEAEA